jgi:hypothetical protein
MLRVLVGVKGVMWRYFPIVLAYVGEYRGAGQIEFWLLVPRSRKFKLTHCLGV